MLNIDNCFSCVWVLEIYTAYQKLPIYNIRHLLKWLDHPYFCGEDFFLFIYSDNVFPFSPGCRSSLPGLEKCLIRRWEISTPLLFASYTRFILLPSLTRIGFCCCCSLLFLLPFSSNFIHFPLSFSNTCKPTVTTRILKVVSLFARCPRTTGVKGEETHVVLLWEAVYLLLAAPHWSPPGEPSMDQKGIAPSSSIVAWQNATKILMNCCVFFFVGGGGLSLFVFNASTMYR